MTHYVGKRTPQPGDHAIGYVRYSTPTQDRAETRALEDILEQDQQGRDIQHHCTHNEYRLDTVYKDVITGKEVLREDYPDLIERVKTGDVDVLVLTSVSRIGRDEGRASAILAAEARHSDVLAETLTGHTFDFEVPTDRLLWRTLSANAEFTGDLLRYRSLRGKQDAAVRGCWPTGEAPYGYESQGRRGWKTLHPTGQAPFVAWLYERYADGSSMRRLQERATRMEGYDGPVSQPGIGRVLQNPVYRGVIVWQDREYEGRHEGLVPDALWEKVAEKRERECPPVRQA